MLLAYCIHWLNTVFPALVPCRKQTHTRILISAAKIHDSVYCLQVSSFPLLNTRVKQSHFPRQSASQSVLTRLSPYEPNVDSVLAANYAACCVPPNYSTRFPMYQPCKLVRLKFLFRGYKTERFPLPSIG